MAVGGVIFSEATYIWPKVLFAALRPPCGIPALNGKTSSPSQAGGRWLEAIARVPGTARLKIGLIVISSSFSPVSHLSRDVDGFVVESCGLVYLSVHPKEDVKSFHAMLKKGRTIQKRRRFTMARNPFFVWVLSFVGLPYKQKQQ